MGTAPRGGGTSEPDRFRFGYRRHPDEDRAAPARHPVVVVGAGPVGLCAAIDLRLRGVPVVLLDDSDRIGAGSRGICYAQRTLEILDRLGIGATLARGVTWGTGKVFQGDALLYAFDLLPEGGHKHPAFINLPQNELEAALCARAGDLDGLDLRWRNRVTGLVQGPDGVRLAVETPGGAYAIEAEYVIAADGARSTIRRLMGLDFAGEVFEDRFLIADVRMRGDFPAERWFWFDPPFHPGRSALLHKQPDDVWRIDLQLGPDADPEAEAAPERVLSRLARMLGREDFALEWVSVYTFQCRRLARFLHDRVIFAGDAAHQVSPFGARGGNSGVQDADNLAWKLARVVRGESDPALLDSYEAERGAAADENIGHSTRSTDFIAPRNPQEARFRDATLALARDAPFARGMVNSGRLSRPTAYDSPLSTPDADAWAAGPGPGAALPDAPLTDSRGRPAFLVDALGGEPVLLRAGGPDLAAPGLRTVTVGADYADREGMFARRFDATPGAAWLVRPDGHLAARWRRPDAAGVAAAARRALGG